MIILKNLRSYKKKAEETARFIRERCSVQPEMALITGTGLGDMVSFSEKTVSLDYEQVPNFPLSTVQSHTGKLMLGNICGRSVLAFQGRFHLYEGYSPMEVTFPIRVLQELGVGFVVISNASGGLNPAFQPGDIMIIKDHINLTGANPLTGPNIDAWGDRFPDMSSAYDPRLSNTAAAGAKQLGISFQTGVYAGLRGPSLETPAEIKFLRTAGADAVGFSTVQEVIASVHAGIRVLGLSTITNVHDPDNPVPASVEEIIQTARNTTPAMSQLIKLIAEKLHDA